MGGGGLEWKIDCVTQMKTVDTLHDLAQSSLDCGLPYHASPNIKGKNFFFLFLNRNFYVLSNEMLDAEH